MTPEGKVKKACRAFLREKGCYVFSPVNMGYGTRTLDDLVCWRGRFISIEYKRPDGGATKAHQFDSAKNITTAGGIALRVSSLEELKQYFDMLELNRQRGSVFG